MTDNELPRGVADSLAEAGFENPRVQVRIAPIDDLTRAVNLLGEYHKELTRAQAQYAKLERDNAALREQLQQAREFNAPLIKAWDTPEEDAAWEHLEDDKYAELLEQDSTRSDFAGDLAHLQMINLRLERQLEMCQEERNAHVQQRNEAWSQLQQSRAWAAAWKARAHYDWSRCKGYEQAYDNVTDEIRVLQARIDHIAHMGGVE